MQTATSVLPDHDAILEVIKRLVGDRKVRVLDLGGGSGVYAVPIAAAGHVVEVLDHSNDALATLARRAQAEGVGERVIGHNVDLDHVAEPLDAASADVVLCHRVLEFVDEPQSILSAAAGVLKDDGLLSVVVANRPGAVLSRIIGGRLDEAAALLDDAVPPPAGHRFDAEEIRGMLEQLGLRVMEVRGVGLIGELNPAESDTAVGRELAGRVAADPFLARAAPALHVIAVRGHGS